MVFLVVVFHAGVTYDKVSMYSTFWIVSDPLNNDYLGILLFILDIFVMYTFFFVSGFLVPLSLKNKTYKKFITLKFKRLIIPWSIAVLTLIPLYKIIYLYSRNMPQEDWTTYFHWNSIWNQSWLWFLPVLFLFNIIYLIFSKIDTSKIELSKFLFFVLILGMIYLLVVRYFNLSTWTTSAILTFQNKRIFIFFLAFLVGSQTFKLNTFKSDIRNKKIEMICHIIGWIAITIYSGVEIYNLTIPGDSLLSKSIDILINRASFLLSLSYLVYSMIIIFKHYLNSKSKIWDELNRNSYGIYIIHFIIMGIIALGLKDIEMPAIIKFLTLTVSTFFTSYLIVYSYKKLNKKIK
ncbi:hypothetical protein BTO04_00575 [Polaribacter sp. SA4-10]|nr:hypothetical protein BTO04_00575 [Polaribacter sp. SA4-10]